MNHTQCAPSAHDRTADPDNQTIDSDGLFVCNDCLRAAFYCANDNEYHHTDPEASCFLIPAWSAGCVDPDHGIGDHPCDEVLGPERAAALRDTGAAGACTVDDCDCTVFRSGQVRPGNPPLCVCGHGPSRHHTDDGQDAFEAARAFDREHWGYWEYDDAATDPLGAAVSYAVYNVLEHTVKDDEVVRIIAIVKETMDSAAKIGLNR